MGNPLESKLRTDEYVGHGPLHLQAGFLDRVTETRENINAALKLVDEIQIVKERLRKTVSFGVEDENIIDSVLSRIESIFILVMDLSRRTSLVDCVCPVLQYLKTIYGSTPLLHKLQMGELIDTIKNGLCEAEDLHAEAGWAETEVVGFLRGPFGRRITQVVNLLLMYGVIEKVKPGSLFKKEMFGLLNVGWERHQNSPSLIVFLMQTADWIFECVIPACKTGNWHLMFSGKDVADLDESYTHILKVCAMHDAGMHEKLSEMGYRTEASLVVKILECIAAHKTYHESLRKLSSKDSDILKSKTTARIIQLEQLNIDLECLWKKKPLRVKPMGFLVAGASDQAKSSIANIINHAVCRKMGFEEGQEYTVMINAMDKYQSNFRSHHVSVIFDDMSNTRSEREETNPLFVVIQFINNMHADALSPIAEMKGKMAILAKVVIVTTNKEDLGASWFSNEPASILRRFWMVVRVKLRDGVKDSSGQIRDDYVGVPMPDMWEVECIRYLAQPSLMPGQPSDAVELPLVKGSVIDLIDYLDANCEEYFRVQERIVESASNMHEAVHCCVHPLYIMPCIKCAANQKRALKPEAGLFWLREMDAAPPDESEEEPSNQAEIIKGWGVRERLRYHCRQYVDLPRETIATLRDELRGDSTLLIGCAVVGALLSVALMGWRMSRPQGGSLSVIEKVARTPKQIAEGDDCWKKTYANSYKYPLASAGMSFAEFEHKIDLNLHVAFSTHYDRFGGKPLFQKRKFCNVLPLKDGWWLIPWHMVKYARTELELRVKAPEIIGVRSMRAVVDNSNRVRVPGKDLALVDLSSCGDTYNFFRFIQEEEEEELPEKLKFYYRHPDTVQGQPAFEEPSDNVRIAPVLGRGREYVIGEGTFDLVTYQIDSFEGYCGAVAVLPRKRPVIYGFHTAGANGKGSCTLVSQKELLPLMAKKTIRVKESAPMPKIVQMKEHVIVPQVHSKNPVCYMPVEGQYTCQIFGSHCGTTTSFRTDVRDSPFRDHFQQRLGECVFTKPISKMARPARRNALLAVTEELPPAEPVVLRLAIDDLKSKITQFVESSDFVEQVHTLTMNDALNGVPGVKGFDPINPKTSMSYPWNCPKWKLFASNELAEALGIDARKILKQRRLEDGKLIYEYCLEFDKEKFDPEVCVSEIVEKFLLNERANVIFRTNLKDEPVKFEKIAQNKLRVFSGAPVDFVIMSRMVFLPVMTAMTYYPSVFESAVGVNAHGVDWAYIGKIIKKFAETRVIAGDFSKFDQKVRPDFSLGAFEVLKHIFELAGASDDILSLIDGIATEVCFPIYEIEGLLTQVLGSVPSGHSLTVVVNGLIVSLKMRYAYYFLHFEEDLRNGVVECKMPPMFHEVVSLVTYGDDNAMSVAPNEEKLNQQSIERVMASIGVVYTSADKTEILTPFTDPDDLEFLKRRFVYDEQFEGIVGPLDKNSIRKMLCVTKKNRGDVIEAEVLTSSWMNAIAEAAFHGKEYFLEVRSSVLELLDGKDKDGHRFSDFFQDLSYDDLIRRFRETTSVYESLDLDKQFRPESGVWDDPILDVDIPWVAYPNVPRHLDHVFGELKIEACCFKARREVRHTWGRYLKSLLCKQHHNIVVMSAYDYHPIRMLQKRNRGVKFKHEDAFEAVHEFVEGVYYQSDPKWFMPRPDDMAGIPPLVVSERASKLSISRYMVDAVMCSPFVLWIAMPSIAVVLYRTYNAFLETGMYNADEIDNILSYYSVNMYYDSHGSVYSFIDYLLTSHLFPTIGATACNIEVEPCSHCIYDHVNGRDLSGLFWFEPYLMALNAFLFNFIIGKALSKFLVLRVPSPSQLRWLCYLFYFTKYDVTFYGYVVSYLFHRFCMFAYAFFMECANPNKKMVIIPCIVICIELLCINPIVCFWKMLLGQDIGLVCWRSQCMIEELWGKRLFRRFQRKPHRQEELRRKCYNLVVARFLSSSGTLNTPVWPTVAK